MAKMTALLLNSLILSSAFIVLNHGIFAVPFLHCDNSYFGNCGSPVLKNSSRNSFRPSQMSEIS